METGNQSRGRADKIARWNSAIPKRLSSDLPFSLHITLNIYTPKSDMSGIHFHLTAPISASLSSHHVCRFARCEGG